MKVKRLISIEEEPNKQLAKEPNASAVIEDALKGYYTNKQLVKQLAKLVQDFEDHYKDIDKRLEHLQRTVNAIAGKAGV